MGDQSEMIQQPRLNTMENEEESKENFLQSEKGFETGIDMTRKEETTTKVRTIT